MTIKNYREIMQEKQKRKMELEQRMNEEAKEIMNEPCYKELHIISKSCLIPEIFQNNPANVYVASGYAKMFGVSLFKIMENMVFLNNQITFKTQFLMALLNKSNVLKGNLRFKIEKLSNEKIQGKKKTYDKNKSLVVVTNEYPDIAVTAYGVHKESEEELSYTVTMRQAVKDEWIKNAKYETMPERMLQNRAAAAFIKLCTPEVFQGVELTEELEDVVDNDFKFTNNYIENNDKPVHQDDFVKQKADEVDINIDENGVIID